MDGSTVLGNPSVIPTVVNTQNNFIQINKFKLTQKSIKQLKPEQLQRVADLLKQFVSNTSPNINAARIFA